MTLPTPSAPWWADPRPLVAVLCGGFGAERAVSEQSGAVVARHLADSPYRPVLVDVAREGWTLPQGEPGTVDLGRFGLSAEGHARAFDAAFVALHGSPGEDGLVPGYLEMLGVPHTAADTRASAVTFDKALCKRAVEGTGVALAEGLIVHRAAGLDAALKSLADWTLPLFVKPNRNGSSCGISKVRDRDALAAALEEGWRYDPELLVERSIEGGTEVTCAVVPEGDGRRTLPICEIVQGEGHDFFDYTAKYTAGEAQEIVPARIPEPEAEAVRAASLAIAGRLDLRGLVRIDYILAGGRAWFLEVNTVPGLSEASIVPKMVAAEGRTLGAFFTGLVDAARRGDSGRKVGF